MRAGFVLLVWLAGCSATTPTVKPEPVAPAPVRVAPDPVHVTLQQFIEAVDQRDFTAARALLSSPWRAQYTAERLQADYAADPLAPERMKRLKAAVALPASTQDPHAELQLDPGRAVKLVREEGGWKISALE